MSMEKQITEMTKDQQNTAVNCGILLSAQIIEEFQLRIWWRLGHA